MKKFLAPLIEKAFSNPDSAEDTGHKTITSLAVNAYRTEMQQQAGNGTPKVAPQKIDPKFMEIAIAQLKIFIFAGHDTTASTLSFAYSLLFQTPTALATIRAEHDAVLGPDPSNTLALLTANPNLLNQLPYTLAVLKETLRLFPPGASSRSGLPDLFLRHPDTGKLFPTDGFMLFSGSWLTHRHPDYWPEPDRFLPERWLAHEGDALHPRKNAWRPFELGPRNCIGQELALLELKAILAMTLRELDFEPAYGKDAPKALGECAYQIMGVGDISGHIKDGYPVRVRVRDVRD